MLYEYIYIYKFTITLLVVRIFSISKLHLQLHNSCHSSVTISLIYARDAFLQLIQFCVMHANKIQTRTQVAHTDALNVCAFRSKIYSTRSHIPYPACRRIAEINWKCVVARCSHEKDRRTSATWSMTCICRTGPHFDMSNILFAKNFSIYYMCTIWRGKRRLGVLLHRLLGANWIFMFGMTIREYKLRESLSNQNCNAKTKDAIAIV